jgi:hypothetical protein
LFVSRGAGRFKNLLEKLLGGFVHGRVVGRWSLVVGYWVLEIG